MNSIERGLCYIRRKKGKSALLLFIFLAAATMVLGILSILKATASVKSEILRNTNTKVTLLVLDSTDLFQQEDVSAVLNTENIASVNRSTRCFAAPANFIPVIGADVSQMQVVIIGYDDLEKDSPFEENICRLVQGTFPTRENEIVINQLLAEVNQLTIGDELTFRTDTGEEYTAFVAGLYLTGNERRQTESVTTENRIENQVYASSDLISGWNGGQYEKLVAYVENPEILTQTADNLRNQFGNRAEISTLSTMYQRMQYSLIQVERITHLILTLTVVTGVLVVGMLLCMWMRSRKIEIVVFISLGLSKGEIYFQMVVETLLLYSLGLLAAAGLYGVFLSGLEKWINTAGGTGLKMTYSYELIGIVWGIGALIMISLVAFAAVPLFRKNLKTILSEMEE